MPIPANATVFTQSMDPADLVDYQVDLADKLLEAGETIASFTLTLDSTAAALGISLKTTGGYAPIAVNSNTSVKFWLEVDPLYQDNVAFEAGVDAALTLTVNTDSTPARRRQRTLVVKVLQL